jgi:hypothetical protein
MNSTLDKDWINRILSDMSLKSKIFNPKLHLKGNRIEEDKFLNECRYQYIQKHENEREAYKAKKAKGLNAFMDENPKVRSSAVHLMLYKKMLKQLAKETEGSEDITRILDVEREICRTDGLNIDDTLNNFAT